MLYVRTGFRKIQGGIVKLGIKPFDIKIVLSSRANISAYIERLKRG